MTVRPIIRFPSLHLRTPAALLTVFDQALAALADDLLDTMRAAPGIGITAPHIGLAERITVIELSPGDGAVTYVNPHVLWQSTETRSHAEGSVSMPGISEQVERPARVRVAYQDIDGVPQEVEADGLLAVCLQHEIDQLDGIFWLQRLSRLKRERAIKRYEKLARA